MNFKISYDYSDLIQELNEEIADGILKNDSIIQVLRDKTKSVYHPIIDWYYSEDKIVEDTTIEFDDSEADKELKREYISRYLDDKPNLELSTVAAILIEMEEMNKIVGDD